MRHKGMLGLSAVALGMAAFAMVGFQPNPIIGLYREQLSPSMFSIWLTGLVLVTSSPILCANLFWWFAKRVRHGWLVHLLFMPAIFAAERGSHALMLFAADEPDLDGPTGWAALPGELFFMLAAVVYFVALAGKQISRSGPTLNGS